MSEYLFTYGTLQPGRAPLEIAATVAQLRVVGRGRVRGVLYDCGEYPGAVLHADAPEIVGTVIELPDDVRVLRALDEYEEFDPRAPESSLFVREMHKVALDSGDTLACWIYVYHRRPGSGTE